MFWSMKRPGVFYVERKRFLQVIVSSPPGKNRVLGIVPQFGLYFSLENGILHCLARIKRQRYHGWHSKFHSLTMRMYCVHATPHPFKFTSLPTTLSILGLVKAGGNRSLNLPHHSSKVLGKDQYLRYSRKLLQEMTHLLRFHGPLITHPFT